MDIQALIDEVKQRFNSEKANGVDFAVQLKLMGEAGGEWGLRIREQKLEVQAGTIETPNLTITAATQDLHDVFTGKLDPARAYMTGKVRVSGDINAAMRLMNLFSRA